MPTAIPRHPSPVPVVEEDGHSRPRTWNFTPSPLRLLSTPQEIKEPRDHARATSSRWKGLCVQMCAWKRNVLFQVTITVENVIGAVLKELTPAGPFNCAIRVSRRPFAADALNCSLLSSAVWAQLALLLSLEMIMRIFLLSYIKSLRDVQTWASITTVFHCGGLLSRKR
ncbi:hypothetical protein BDZ89DRAFT_441312 [Hymenopellis radicata]|nr:hypothetical protein BDZ89DRAFT_441312 [Hymenopellis radicata]